ncbi:hypothetical protein SBC1_26760 [Caballeronia sp. SBC1]|uniref:hypothetical protein n=1 Tax=Caballeronia sp. SBC1 TaxID=2705548 RepID=UPI0014099CBF|nr:hypothetical protein [Caballeronia sp. SBC1]QIN62660.1 hypothetical protein SBC1_26760 [Caballeronia sp. SBC1]
MQNLTFCIVAALALSPTFVQAEEESIQTVVPEGVYIHKFKGHPPCGVSKSPLAVLSNPAFVAATGAEFGPHAATVVVIAAQADQISDSHGGELAKYWNKALGKKDVASCSVVCVRTPKGAKVKTVELSGRHGNTFFKLPVKYETVGTGKKKTSLKSGVLLQDGMTGDYSGWRDVIVTRTEGRTNVCGTATNWQDHATATKLMVVRY